MTSYVCASCKNRVEDGGVRCTNCGAKLYQPGAFLNIVGWVVISLSLIPFSIAEVTTSERDYTPVVLGAAIVLAGIVMIVIARGKNKTAPPAVIEETASSASS